MDKYNKSVQHQWFHHATWGSPKYKNEGVGEVTWHSLTENGKVEFCNIKFGNKTYENVNVKHLNPLKMESHKHPRQGDELDDKKKKKMVEVNQVPSKPNNTKDHVNMRTTWSGQTKVEFSQTTIDQDIADRNAR